MTQLPDEPALAHALRSGYPQIGHGKNAEDIYELNEENFTQIILKRCEVERGEAEKNDEED